MIDEEKNLEKKTDDLNKEEKNTGPSIEERVKKYEDIEGISTRKLDIGLWFVKNYKYFRLGFIICLIILSFVSWSYTISNFAYYYIKGIYKDELMIREITESYLSSHDYIKETAPKDLILSPLEIFKANNKYDILALIKNPNLKHWGRFAYCFLDGNNEFSCANSFIYPGESKYLLSLAQDLTASPGNIKLVIDDLNWGRVNRRVTGEWENYYNNHMDIITGNINFTPKSANNLSENIDLSLLEFTAANKTAYNYWVVNFNILFYNNNSLVGVNKYSLEEFLAGAEEKITMSWPNSFSRANKIQIIPEVDIFDENNYIKYEGGAGEEK